MELRCGGASRIGGAEVEAGAASAAHKGSAGVAATTAAVAVGALKRASLTAPSAQGDITPKKQQALRGVFAAVP
jgi:hypothetical protein